MIITIQPNKEQINTSELKRRLANNMYWCVDPLKTDNLAVHSLDKDPAFDELMIKYGNMFKNKKEAKANIDSVKRRIANLVINKCENPNNANKKAYWVVNPNNFSIDVNDKVEKRYWKDDLLFDCMAHKLNNIFNSKEEAIENFEAVSNRLFLDEKENNRIMEKVKNELGEYVSTFKIPTHPHDDTHKLYKKTKFSFYPGLTVLVGCNGSGKTTLVDLIEEQLKEDNIPVLKYNNLTDGNSNAKSSALFNENYEVLANLICSSEGECIITNVGNMAGKIGSWVRNNFNKPEQEREKELWIIFDGIDSGLSIDNIQDIKSLLFDTILDDVEEKSLKVYILVTTNSYEMTVGATHTMDVQSGKYVNINSYDSYREVIMKSADYKEKQINKISCKTEKE